MRRIPFPHVELSGRSHLGQNTIQRHLRSARLVSLLPHPDGILLMFKLGLLMTTVSDTSTCSGTGGSQRNTPTIVSVAL